VDPRRVTTAVLTEVEAKLRAVFAYEARDFGQPVTAAEVVKLIHEVDGVVAVDLDVLAPYSEEAAVVPDPADTLAVAAHPARWNSETRGIDPAELLLINPVGIRIEEMKP
jgi:hypothetical protein